jgi:MFS family permease
MLLYEYYNPPTGVVILKSFMAASISNQSNRSFRWAVACLFFLQGFCFASWASRIPTIQQQLNLSVTWLGVILLALPVGSMLALTISGWLVTRFGSKRIAFIALTLYSIILFMLGVANQVSFLVLVLILFGMAGNISNIAINTQAVGVEMKYGRSIMASFHGFWSFAGFTAAGIGSLMIRYSITPLYHFLLVMAVILIGVSICYQYLVPDEKSTGSRAPLFVKPDKTLWKLGIIAFCCMICEGAMFDWSGIYFKKVVQADKNWLGAGYTAFMCTMATGRFLADKIVIRLGFIRTIQLSGLLIAGGLSLAILFPYVPSAIAGFFIVGFGVSSVVPLVYSQAGRSPTMSPGMALAAVSSIGFLGFLVGPPLIGLVAGIFSLRISFLIIGMIGIIVVLIARTSTFGSDTK